MQAITNTITYGKCRCCLAKGNHQYNCQGMYTDMITECLNLLMVNDQRITRLMCEQCATFLKDVQKFRDMVLASEKQLLQEILKETVYVDVPIDGATYEMEQKVKEESFKTEETVDTYKNDMDSSVCGDSIPSDMIEDTKIDDIKSEIELTGEIISDMETYEDDLITNSSSKHHIKSSKRKSIKKKKYDSESDTPISEIKEKKARVKKKILDENNIDTKTYISLTTPHSKQESLKDNNKIRANIILLLKHSTILPFRNNFRTSYKCFYCEKLYIPFNELREHIEKEHLDISENTIDKCLRSMQDLILSADISCIKCRLCLDEFKTIDTMIEHLINIHNKIFYKTIRKPSHGILGFDLGSDILKCHVCSKEFAFFKNLSIHMNEHYGLFVCYVCGKKFLSEHRYKCHVFNHHENKETKCKHCGENFKTEASMAYHIKKEHLKRTIKCPKCPETFPFTQYMKRLNHMAVVHGIKKPVFKCDTCGKEYANSGSLAAHKRYTHKRTKEHRCDICGYITVHNTVMKNHMDVHNGVKNYECSFCKKKFAKPYTLKLHLKIHLNDKKFVCSICEAAFIQKNSLKNHVKARHPDSGIDISKL